MYPRTVESAVVIFFVQNFGLSPCSASAVLICLQPLYNVWCANRMQVVELCGADWCSSSESCWGAECWVAKERWSPLRQVSACEQRIRARVWKVLKKQNKKKCSVRLQLRMNERGVTVRHSLTYFSPPQWNPEFLPNRPRSSHTAQTRLSWVCHRGSDSTASTVWCPWFHNTRTNTCARFNTDIYMISLSSAVLIIHPDRNIGQTRQHALAWLGYSRTILSWTLHHGFSTLIEVLNYTQQLLTKAGCKH